MPPQGQKNNKAGIGENTCQIEKQKAWSHGIWHVMVANKAPDTDKALGWTR